MNENNVAPLVIVLLVIAGISAYFVYSRHVHEMREEARIVKTVHTFQVNGVVKNAYTLNDVMQIQLRMRENGFLAPGDIATLSEVSAGPTDPIVQAKAIATLEVLAAKKRLTEVQKATVAEKTLPAIRSSASLTREYECSLLGSLRQTQSIPVLTKASADPDPNVRISAKRALGKIGSVALVTRRSGVF